MGHLRPPGSPVYLYIYRGSTGLSWGIFHDSSKICSATYPLFINRAYLNYRYFLSHEARHAGKTDFSSITFEASTIARRASSCRVALTGRKFWFVISFLHILLKQTPWNHMENIWKHICFVTGSLWNWIGRNPKGKLSPTIFQGWTC